MSDSEIVEAESNSMPALPQTLNEAQLNMLQGDTPEQYIKQRKARGGRKQDYVEIHYVRDQLNKIFGHNWDEEIVDKQITDSGHIICHVRLRVRANGEEVVKDGIGGDVITTFKNSNEPVDIGDDVKSAVADGLKKAASKFGIAQDVYWQSRPSNHTKQGEIPRNSNETGDSGQKGRGKQGESGKDLERYAADDGTIATSEDDGDPTLWKAFRSQINKLDLDSDYEDFKGWFAAAHDTDQEKLFSSVEPHKIDWLIDNLEDIAREYENARQS